MTNLVEAPRLAVPFFDGVQRRLARKVEHEEDGDGVVAHEREHVDEFTLPAQVPDAEGDFSVADGNGLFHKVDAWESMLASIRMSRPGLAMAGV